MECKICFERFNRNDREPRLCLPCCHTICLECLTKLDSHSVRFSLDQPPFSRRSIIKQCPTCRELIETYKPNFSIIELLDSHLVVDKNTDLKDKIRKDLKDIKSSSQLLWCDGERKKEEINVTVDSVKEQVYKATQNLIEQLMQRQEELITEVEQIRLKAVDKIKCISQEPPFLFKDLDSLSRPEMEAYLCELNVVKFQLTSKANDLNAIEPRIEIEPVEYSCGTLIGFVSHNLNAEPQKNPSRAQFSDLNVIRESTPKEGTSIQAMARTIWSKYAKDENSGMNQIATNYNTNVNRKGCNLRGLRATVPRSTSFNPHFLSDLQIADPLRTGTRANTTDHHPLIEPSTSGGEASFESPNRSSYMENVAEERNASLSFLNMLNREYKESDYKSLSREHSDSD